MKIIFHAFLIPSVKLMTMQARNLSDIRKEIIRKSSSLKSVIEKILKGFSSKYLVQEEYVTQRDGRLSFTY